VGSGEGSFLQANLDVDHAKVSIETVLSMGIIDGFFARICFIIETDTTVISFSRCMGTASK
jgi:hypothetical protein